MEINFAMQDGSSLGRLELELADDDQFIASQTQIHLIEEVYGGNVSSSTSKPLDVDWRPLKSCFYRGRLHPEDDPDSKAILSLCHGLVSVNDDLLLLGSGVEEGHMQKKPNSAANRVPILSPT